MSRIIVKQLPKNIGEEKLRQLFGSRGAITDIQLKYTPDGKFRQFCFIGYSSEDEASAAITHFNNTCVQTSRIKVELCAALGSEEKPQSWSRYAKDSNRHPDMIKAKQDEAERQRVEWAEGKSKKKVNKVDEIIGERKNDPEFLEFMKAHDKHRALWANDAGLAEKDETTDTVQLQSDKGKVRLERSEKNGNNFAADDENEIDNNNIDNDDDNKDDATQPNDDDDADDDDEDDDSKLAEKPISDLEYMKTLMSTKNTKAENKVTTKSQVKSKSGLDLFTIKMHNVPYKTKRQEILKFFKPLKPYSVRLPSKVHGFCYVGFKTDKEMTKAMLKNKSFIRGKQVFFADFTEKNKITKSKLNGGGGGYAGADGNSEPKSGNAKWQQQANSLIDEENISESGRIFFRNLPYTTTEDELQKLFENFGPVTEVHLPVDDVTRQIKGFGTVTFVMPEHAMLAFNKLDGADFHGRLLHLIPGKSKVQLDDIDENDTSLTFKQKKALKLKKHAQQSGTWNTLFMGVNAVADILSKQLNMSKEQILGTGDGSSNAAVRLALGETQIVIEMKKFLEDQGVNLSAFEAHAVKRSKMVILAKNLPADTTVSELTPLFAKFGPIGRLVMPPSGVTALIEYCDPSEARLAFKRLAFSKFKTLPLFLEWAPEHVFKTTLSGEPSIAKLEEPADDVVAAVEPAAQQEEQLIAEQAPDDADDVPESNTTLFLRNLNFSTVQDTVYRHFEHLGTIHTVEIAKRKDPQNPRQMNSLGYGFVQFKKATVAEKALRSMQLTKIDGNQVELKRSDRILKTNNNNNNNSNNKHYKQSTVSEQTGTKILIRNIPFQANHKEVRDLFKAFGELRSLRIPRKMTPGEDAHRGFGFVDYMSKSDAKNAFQALSASTHLYGRRLVLEWASTAENAVEELRKRVATHFNASINSSSTAALKRSKRAVFDAAGNINEVANVADDDDDVE